MARDPQNLHGPSLLSQCILDAPQFPQSSLFALSLLRSYRESLSVTRGKAIVSSRRASYLAASFATTVCASKELYLTAAVAAHEHSWSPLHYHTSPSLCLLPRRTRVQDTPLSFRLLSAMCSCGFSTRGFKTFWHLCLQLSLFVLCHTSLWATSLLLSPLAAPSIYHTDIELRRHACRRLSPVSPVQSVSSGCTSERSRHYPGCLELGAFQFVFVGLEIQGLLAGSAYSQQAFLGRSVDGTRCPRDQSKFALASRITRLFLGASLLVMLSCLSYVPPMNSSISVVGIP